MALLNNNKQISKIYLGNMQIKSIMLNGNELFPHRKKTQIEIMNENMPIDDVPVAPIEPTAREQIAEYSAMIMNQESNDGIELPEWTTEEQEYMNSLADELFPD